MYVCDKIKKSPQ